MKWWKKLSMTPGSTGRADALTWAILGAATALFIQFYFCFPYEISVHDTIAHIDYIQYLLTHFRVPPPGEGWEFFQPPLYYGIAALWSTLCHLIAPLVRLPSAVSLLSLVFYLGYLGFTAAALRRGISSRAVYYLSLVCLAFWPCGVFMATRINNDIPLYFFYSAAFYYLMIWRDTGSMRTLGAAVLMGALATAVKTNGIIVLGLIALVVCYRLYRGRLTLRALWNRTLIAYTLLALVLVSTNMGRSLYYHVTENRALIVGNVSAHYAADPKMLTSSLYSVVSFDYASLLQQPFYNVYMDSTGRRYFWVAMLKTSLFDEAMWPYSHLAALLNLENLLFWLYGIGTALAVIAFGQRAPAGTRFALVSIVFPLAFLIYPCLTLPTFWACMQEFRYVQPILIPLFLLYDRAIVFYRSARLPVMANAGLALLLAFAISIVAFDYRMFI